MHVWFTMGAWLNYKDEDEDNVHLSKETLVMLYGCKTILFPTGREDETRGVIKNSNMLEIKLQYCPHKYWS